MNRICIILFTFFYTYPVRAAYTMILKCKYDDEKMAEKCKKITKKRQQFFYSFGVVAEFYVIFM